MNSDKAKEIAKKQGNKVPGEKDAVKQVQKLGPETGRHIAQPSSNDKERTKPVRQG